MTADEPLMPDSATDRPVATSNGRRPSHWLSAELEPETGAILAANAPLKQLVDLEARQAAGETVRLPDLFRDLEAATWTRLYHRQLLPHILQQFYGLSVETDRLQREPTAASLASRAGDEPRYLLFWLQLVNVQLERRARDRDELAGVDVAALLRDNPPSQQLWEERIAWDNYRVRGRLLWEGCDITSRETVQRLTRALIDPGRSLPQHRFAAVAVPLCHLFRADSLAIIEPRSQRWQIFTTAGDAELQAWPESADFARSQLGQAIAAERVWNVADLHQVELTDCDRLLLERGWRSLLLVPIQRPDAPELLGLVVAASQQPQHFDQVDAEQAAALIPGWRAALSQSNQQVFSHIHPSVEWRFQQEAERRSLGLPAQPIAFEDVYPMYAISDIRGSSEERNRAIQRDLIAQFRLALAAVEAALADHAIAFLEQLRLDLLAYIDRLKAGIAVEDEVTAVDYLREHFEVYGDYFQQGGAAVVAAMDAYQQAIANEQRCCYAARAAYDRTLQAVASQLRATWERWQQVMQAILPHYCDLEVSDGIDHMLYVGGAIAPHFSRFHLHSLRYEQLRAMCDCARTCNAIADSEGKPVQVAHLVLVQEVTVDIFHDERTERLFDVRGTRDTRYEIVKKRIDKGIDAQTRQRITQPGTLTIVYSTDAEWREYHQYLRYLLREGWIEKRIESGTVDALQGVTGLRYARVSVRPQ